MKFLCNSGEMIYNLLKIKSSNGNLLQYSFLENPRDRGAWWAAFSGVAQSWTRLKQLSSSSSISNTLKQEVHLQIGK